MDQSEPRETTEERNDLPQPTDSRMNRRAIILTIALFVLVIAAMFAFAFMGQEAVTEEPVETEEEADGPYAHITRIDGKHFYIDGVHTIVGELSMPTPCDLLEGSARVAESMPEEITFAFDVINNAETCAQAVTQQRFKVSAEASPEASMRATFEGRPVELNLIEAAPGETPEEFELFIKG